MTSATPHAGVSIVRSQRRRRRSHPFAAAVSSSATAQSSSARVDPHIRRKPPPTAPVTDWLRFVQARDVERVCCLLDDPQLDAYESLLDTCEAAFGAAVVRNESVVVHCSAGPGRTGHVLALLLAATRQYALADAIATVRRLGRRPLEAATYDQLRTRLEAP